MCGRQVEAGESRFQNIPHSMKSEEVLFSPEGTPEEEPVVGRMETESLSSLRDSQAAPHRPPCGQPGLVP